jgi:outer membrane protein OmpA-like peptidoglycan-associated protein
MAIWRRVSFLASTLCLNNVQMVLGQSSDPLPKPAIEYVIDAFDRYPLVALSEIHNSVETKDFLGTLIRHPAFTSEVTDIVVEFGNARYQRLVDRYIAGEDVAREELRQVWENTTQISGVWSSAIYENILSDIRAFNKTKSAPNKIRVLLGDPPIDWEAVTSPADEDMNDWRDAHYAWVVEQEIMKKGRKALLFIGGAHISRKVTLPNNLIHLLDAHFPGKTLVVSAVDLTRVMPELASRIRAWQTPSAAEVHGTWLGMADVNDIGFSLSKGRVQDDVDVVLYLTASAFSIIPPRIDPNSAYGAEMRRRQKLAEETLPFRGGKIRFEKGSTSLTQESKAALESVLEELQRDHGLVLLVKAYADSTESNPQELSQRRAELLVNWLVHKGIGRRRLAKQGCGSSRPAWDSDTEQHRSANRRAELVRQDKRAGCQPPQSFDWAAPTEPK